MLLGAALLCLPAAISAQRGPVIAEEAVLALKGDAEAVAINADESILAVAETADGDVTPIALYDRPSRALLGRIASGVGAPVALRFSPVEDVLLVAGDAGLELWELPISPLDPEHPLSAEHLRWRESTDVPPTVATFDPSGDAVFWSAGGTVTRRPVSRDGTTAALWQSDDDRPIRALVVLTDGERLAVALAESKAIELIDAKGDGVTNSLEGHRFPVLALLPTAEAPLLSLDAGNNLVRWDADFAPAATTFLEHVPRDFSATGLYSLGSRHLLLTGKEGGRGRALVLDATTRQVVTEVPMPAAAGLAVSPTGRYVAVGDGPRLHLYGFGQPTSPMDYVRHLQALNAEKTAQSYVRLMDDSTLSSQRKADLLAELSRQPPEQRVADYLRRMALARQSGDSERVRYWAEQVLAVQPEQPEALAELKRLRLEAEQAVLDRARAAMARGQYRYVISMLDSGIPEDSPTYAEAAVLIKQAEAQRAIQTLLDQARDKMNLGDNAAAEALVQEALRRDPEHPAALALADEIDDRQGTVGHEVLAALLGALAAVAIVAFAMRRWRGRLRTVLSKIRLDEEPAPYAAWNRRGAATAEAAHAGSAPRPPPAGAPASKVPPRTERTQPEARRKVVDELVAKTERMLRLARQADVARQHTALLMELEAELEAIQRRLEDPLVELGGTHQRLKEMVGQLRGLKFSRPQPEKEPAATGDEPTYYELLNLPPTASQEEIKSAYYRLLKQYHPDLHNHSTFDWVKAEAERMSRKLGEAYEVLSDARAREQYDRQLRRRRGAGP